jgi:ABC-type lipoprotein release transport system permease subunit
MVIVILTVSTGLALTMLTVYGASKNQINNIVAEFSTDITVRPAGSFGFMGSDASLSEDNATAVSQMEHVIHVQKSVSTQYTGTDLVAANPFSGRTSGGQGQIQVPSGGGRFMMGIIALGVDPSNTNPQLMGGGSITSISAGRYFNADENNANIVIFGTALATANSLDIGDSINVNGTEVELIGIFESGQMFGNNMMLFPTDTIMRLFSLTGYSDFVVTVDATENVSSVATTIKNTLGADQVDVMTPESRFEAMNSSLNSASKTSQIGTIAAIAVAVVVIVVAIILTMRQRVKEVGILKAIGASNWHITLGFGAETLVISLISAVIGALLTFPLAKVVSGLIISTPATTIRSGFTGGGGSFGGNVAIAGFNVAVSPEIFLYAIGIAVVLAVAASIFPSWYIARVKPAEVLRSE